VGAVLAVEIGDDIEQLRRLPRRIAAGAARHASLAEREGAAPVEAAGDVAPALLQMTGECGGGPRRDSSTICGAVARRYRAVTKPSTIWAPMTTRT
jgi:hypothetical protein